MKNLREIKRIIEIYFSVLRMGLKVGCNGERSKTYITRTSNRPSKWDQGENEYKWKKSPKNSNKTSTQSTRPSTRPGIDYLLSSKNGTVLLFRSV